MITGRYGRMGNRIWTFANVLAFARDNGIKVSNLAFSQYEDFFEGRSGLAANATPIKWLGEKALRLLYKVNLRLRLFPVIELGESGFLNLDATTASTMAFFAHRFVFFSGFYFGAARSLLRQGDFIRSYFSLKPALLKRVNNLVQVARGNADILIGIHMRQGDYRTFCEGTMYYSRDEYLALMRWLEGQCIDRKVVFLVCSDEAQDFSDCADLRVVVSADTPIVDLYALAQCDYICGPNSSFSHWASFVGKVPLHILDWRTQERIDGGTPIREPDLRRDFLPFDPELFPVHSSHEKSMSDFH